MSLRELKGLETVNIAESRLRPKKQHSSSLQLAKYTCSEESHSYPSVTQMSSGDSDGQSVEGLQAELERLRGELSKKDAELEELKATADTAMNGLAEAKVQTETTTMLLREELREAKEATVIAQRQLESEREVSSERITTLESELGELQRNSELDRLQTLREHQSRLDMVMNERNRDVGRMENWLDDLRKSHQRETAQLLEKITILEREHSTSTVPSPASSPTPASVLDPMITTSSDTVTDFSARSRACTRMTSSTMPATTGLSTAHMDSTLFSGTLPFLPSVSTSGGPLPVMTGFSAAPTTNTVSLPSVPLVSTSSSSLPVTAGFSAARTTSALSCGAQPFLPSSSTSCGTLPVATGLSTAHTTNMLLSSGPSFRPLASPFLSSLPGFGFIPTSTHLPPTAVGAALPTTTSCFVPTSSITPVAPLFTPPYSASATAPGVSLTSTLPTTATTTDPVVQSMARLLQAQTEVMTAQAKATILQTLPALSSYTGEGTDISDDGFDKWIERFQERAKFAGWDEKDQLYHLKLLLEKTALETFRMLPDSEKSDIQAAISALQKRFKPGGIEELRGLEFHHKTQGTETIEQLGLSIQQLGRKAFPSITGKDFDRLLKGRFYQALLVKWQRKLGAPKAEESFHDLYTRARLLEEYEKQYTASAESRNANSSKDRDSKSSLRKSHYRNRNQEKESDQQSSSLPVRTELNKRMNPSTTTLPNKERKCYSCGQTGHLRNACPKRAEAPGQSRTSTTSNVSSVADPKDLSEEQLEQLLAAKKLEREKSLLEVSNSSNNVVNADCSCAGAVGSLLEVELSIEGVPIIAMLDTGAQSTIISRSALHDIANHLHQVGKDPPMLELPTARLFGKDGQKGGNELCITAQVSLSIQLKSRTVTVPVFVQPDSEQRCLLGMNAIPLLGIEVRHHDGEPILFLDKKELPSGSVTVNLVGATSIPAQAGRIVRAKLSVPGALSSRGTVLFEPCHEILEPLGLNVMESLVSMEDNEIVLPVENHQGNTVYVSTGVQLGTVRNTDVDATELVEVSEGPVACNASVQAKITSCERAEKLPQLLCLPLVKLSPEENIQLKELVTEFNDVFALSDAELGCTHLVEHEIDTGNHAPIRQPPYRTPVIRRQKMNEMVAAMQAQGIVEPSSSAWASPVVLVPKKDGELRFCIDYRRLNSVTRKDVYPLPRVDDILVALGEARYFTTLDFASGYWQIALEQSAKEKSAFVTHNGLFEFVRMPFGLCNAPATFQRLMQRVLAGLEYECCFVYLDDILVASRTFNEHLSHLREVFTRIQAAHLRLKPKKCQLLRERVLFLGHVVSATGIEPDPQKTEKIRSFPTPTDVTSLRRFLGLASYYRRFVQDFAIIAAPLNQLTRKDVAFEWSESCQKSFEQLKSALVSTPVLVYPKFGPGNTFILETDASKVGLGAVLSQMQEDGTVHPIAYASRSTDKHERNYGISELETLGLVWAVRHFRPYILGHHCTVYTDHAACLSILNTSKPSGKLARWALTIQEMDLSIKHKAGRSNKNADALSRCSEDKDQVVSPASDAHNGCVGAVHASKCSELSSLPNSEAVRKLQTKDKGLNPILTYLTSGDLPEDGKLARRTVFESKMFNTVDGVLHREDPSFPSRNCIVVPSSLRDDLIREAHQGRFAGHLAQRKVYDRLRRYVWWRGMRSDIDRYCKSCLVCVSRKGGCRPSKPPLHSIPVGGPFHRVAVDVLQLPLTVRGNKYVVVFIDYFTKWPEAFAVPDQKMETIAKLFVEQIVCRHGIPEELLSDRGANFLSALVEDICKLLGVRKINTSGYHPQTDGLVEKFNSTLVNMIAKSCDISDRDWDDHLDYLLFAYRASAQESTKESPFFMMYGRDPRIPTETILTYERSPYAVDVEDYKTDLCSGLSSAWSLARENLEKAQVAQKKYYDQSAMPTNVKPGDRVMVYMPGERRGKTWKLARPFHGPYRVVAVTDTNVEVRLVNRPLDQPIFVHLDRVRRCNPQQIDGEWTGPRNKRRRKKKLRDTTPPPKDQAPIYSGPITRSRST